MGGLTTLHILPKSEKKVKARENCGFGATGWHVVGQTAFTNLYTYTKTGQVESITQDGKRVHYHYDASDMRTATQLFSQGNEVIATSQTYDGMGRLTQIKHGDIAQYDYAWDAANRITSMNDAKYDYDATNQLTSATYDKLPAEAYDYDANGNRKAY